MEDPVSESDAPPSYHRLGKLFVVIQIMDGYLICLFVPPTNE
jgi:hypothetical protein